MPGFAATRLEEYALILPGPPLARQVSRRALRGTDATRRLAPIQSAQQNLRQELARRKIKVSGSAQTLLNAVFVRVPRARVAELQSLAGVQRVVWMPPLKPHLNLALNLVNVPTAWNALPGGAANAGAGTSIAIIDSGIDDTHPAFQDASLSPPSGFPLGDTTHTNGKIIVARSYESMFYLPDDTSPIDRVGHGTALAMIAAGVTNTGPLASITGVAPKAWLGNYKIFGSPGVNDTTYASIITQALTDAYNDGMDIALLALGYPAAYAAGDGASVCGSSGPCDPIAYVVESAIQSGMTVVVSAGNDAQSGVQPPSLNTIDSPGTAPDAITVGASTNAHAMFAAVELSGASGPTTLGTLSAVEGDGPRLAGPLQAPIIDVSTVDTTGLACSQISGRPFAGAIVLIERGNCDYSIKINYAQLADAVGVVIYQSDASAALSSNLGAGNTGIPTVMIGNADGLALKAYLQANPGTKAILDPALTAQPATSDLVADFTSRGPSIDGNVKPDLAAVGDGIYTATQALDPNGSLYDPTGYTTVSGSSFAAAMVAGAAALVLQANANFNPAEIKSALVNTASSGAITDNSGSGEPLVTAVGAGNLNAAAAISPGATVAPATLSFGVVGPGSPASAQTLYITNVSGTAATFKISFTPDVTDPDSTDQLIASPASLQIGAGQTATLAVSLKGGFSFSGIYSGVINVTGPATALRVPYWYLESDGVPFDIIPIIDSSFSGTVGDKCWQVAFKVVDQFGIAIPGLPASFGVQQGNGTQSTAATCPSGVQPGPDTQTYAYGVAATNFDLGSSTGDQIFAGSAGGLSTLFYANVRPQPVISAVKDAASFQTGGFAPGSYIAIYGSALCDATQGLSTGFLPFGMSGASVTFYTSDGNTAWPGRVSYVSPGQVNVQIPWELAGLTAAQVVVNVGDSYASAPITIANAAPAMFLYSAGAIAQDLNYHLVTAVNPAQPGHTIVLYANGLGAVDNPPPSGEVSVAPPARTLITPTVSIGNLPATVSFSGLTPGSIGLYQINVTVPANAPSGPQPVIIKANGVNSATANLPIQ